jgi:alkylhydroperoxidase family enzyme
MTATTTFIEFTADDAPDGSRPALVATKQGFGFVPAAMARMAASPAAVAAFGSVHAIFEKTGFTTLEKEVLAMTMGLSVGCEVCIALHSALLARAPEGPPVSRALREDAPLPSPKLEALRAFVRSALEHRGEVPEADLASFLAAGFTREQALDAMVGIGLYTLSTYANRLTRAPIDPPFAAFARAQ